MKAPRYRLLHAIFCFSCTLFVTACEKALSPTSSLEIATKGLHAAAISEKGHLIIAGSIYHGGSLWQVQSEERVFNWNHANGELSTIIAADFSGNGQWGLTADPATIVLWNTETGEGYRYWTAPGEILDAELGPGATSAFLGLSDHSAVLFDIQQGGIKKTFKHSNRVRSVDLSENGQLGITGSEDYTATLWDMRTGKAITRLKHNDDVQLVKLSNDGAIALSVSKYDAALLWQARTGEIIGEIPLKAEHLKRGLSFTAAQFSDDNNFLLTGRPDQIVQLWQLPELVEIERWQLPKRDKWKPTSAAVIAVAFSDIPQQFYAIGANGFIHQLETKTPNSMPGVLSQ
ncbi:WD40 repeat domain-containing protein [Teredinibacter purpureus]|uniref:WD40 repeat domain-containing protein n=1 Tax=Teredinibacter purpureus TaxID=2731756 RepID=UPI0005F7651C|nr:hypothetical protein [Teredinibacter purpureus]